MFTRLFLTITEAERDALRQLARNEKRDTRQQAAFIIRQELQRRGLLVDSKTITEGGEHAEPTNL